MSHINFDAIDLKALEVPKFAAMTGRVKKFLAAPERGLMPASCTTYEFDHERNLQHAISDYQSAGLYITALGDMMDFVAKSLKGASGVKLQLGQWRQFPTKFFNSQPQWLFYLNPEHPDFDKITDYHSEYYDIHEGLKPNHVVIEVADSLADREDFRMSLIGSWKHFMRVLLNG